MITDECATCLYGEDNGMYCRYPKPIWLFDDGRCAVRFNLVERMEKLLAGVAL